MTAESTRVLHYFTEEERMVGTGRFELPTPRTPSECSTRLSHVPTSRKSAASCQPQRMGLTLRFYTTRQYFRLVPGIYLAKGAADFASLDGRGRPCST